MCAVASWLLYTQYFKYRSTPAWLNNATQEQLTHCDKYKLPDIPSKTDLDNDDGTCLSDVVEGSHDDIYTTETIPAKGLVWNKQHNMYLPKSYDANKVESRVAVEDANHDAIVADAEARGLVWNYKQKRYAPK